MTGKIAPRDEDSTTNLLTRTAVNLAEGLSGLAASDRKDVYLSFGYLFQRVRSGRFLDTLTDEWNKYRSRGKVKDDYLDTEQHRECLQEVLDFLDNDSADETRFNAIKQVFLNAASEQFAARDSILPQQFMKICRTLSSGEVLILQAIYRSIVTGQRYSNSDHVGEHQWLTAIAERSGLQHVALVESYEQKLISKYLISPRKHADKSGVTLTSHDRLTEFGYSLCQFICEPVAKDN